MKLSAPKSGMFYISVVMFILGVLAALFPTLGFESYAIWIVSIAFLLLAVGSFTK